MPTTENRSLSEHQKNEMKRTFLKLISDHFALRDHRNCGVSLWACKRIAEAAGLDVSEAEWHDAMGEKV